jgi:predicted ATPase
MPRAVLTGGPGAGKTTLLHALAKEGLKVVDESARAVIQERRKQGLSPRPPPLDFASEILRRDAESYELAQSAPGWTVYDRGAIEAIAGVHALDPVSPAELRQLLRRYQVDRVFILPPWPSIYTTDEERDQTVEEAALVYERVRSWYQSVGYSLVELPHCSVAQRVSLVLHALSDA